jgi:hypothetical protein
MIHFKDLSGKVGREGIEGMFSGFDVVFKVSPGMLNRV